MEVLYPGNLALLSMFLKNPDNEKDEIKKDERKKGKFLISILFLYSLLLLLLVLNGISFPCYFFLRSWLLF